MIIRSGTKFKINHVKVGNREGGTGNSDISICATRTLLEVLSAISRQP
ncbi:hypothetical protein [Moorena sp. SIO2C4]|nr:hypothetical protein [Moorena sp. SIO2C4]NES43468.1 hypothetical protein [Moorena sp. SIO2C4]